MEDTRQLEALLERLEDSFWDQLLSTLQHAANGHDAWLFVRKMTALQFGLDSRHSERAEALAIIAEEIVGLREDLNCEDLSCPAARFLQTCSEGADLDREKQLGPQRTARDLLKELRTTQR